MPTVARRPSSLGDLLCEVMQQAWLLVHYGCPDSDETAYAHRTYLSVIEGSRTPRLTNNSCVVSVRRAVNATIVPFAHLS
jgi:hypothetical protein